MKSPYDVIIKPIITEKSMKLVEVEGCKYGKYTFDFIQSLLSQACPSDSFGDRSGARSDSLALSGNADRQLPPHP